MRLCWVLNSYADFIRILQAPDGEWEARFDEWVKEDAVRDRLKLQARLAELAKRLVDNSHSDLIKASHEIYATRFLPNYQVIYIDDGDGDRITDAQKEKLK